MTRQRIATAIGLAALMLAAPAAAADQVVYFVNGKAITVKSVEKGPRITVLEIEGGGRIGVPTEQIERIEELQPASPPSTFVPAPSPAPVPPPTAPPAATGALPSPAANASADLAKTEPAPPTPASGPGMGGKTVGPGSMPLNPVALGEGTASADQARPAGMAQPPAGARRDGMMGRTGAMQNRRFNSRGNPYTRTRPGGNYMPPQRPPSAPGATQNPPPPPPNPLIPPPEPADGGAEDDPGAAPPADPDAAPPEDGGDSGTPATDDGNES